MEARANRSLQSYPSYKKFKQNNDNLLAEERKTEYKQSKERQINLIAVNPRIRYVPLKCAPRTKTNFLSQQIDTKMQLFKGPDRKLLRQESEKGTAKLFIPRPPRLPSIKRNYTGSELEIKENLNDNIDRKYQSSFATRGNPLRKTCNKDNLSLASTRHSKILIKQDVGTSSSISRRKALASHRVKTIGRKPKRVFTLNTYSSRGELETLQFLIQKNGWEEGTNPNEGHLIWFGQPLRESDIQRLLKRPDVYFNKYSGSEYLCRKKTLCTNINRMKYLFPDEYNFVPTEFNYPEEKDKLEEYIKANPSDWMIAKPSRGCGGEGIFLFKNKFYSPILNNEFVIQKYVAKPLLVEGK